MRHLTWQLRTRHGQPPLAERLAATHQQLASPPPPAPPADGERDWRLDAACAEVDPDLPLRAAHDLGEQARHAIFHAVAGVAAVDLHLDPAGLAEHDSHGRTLHHRGQGSR